ncbi:P-loop containing nucleoside triphosphate hydrolase protein [Irpex rosettiformis]|uniref:P-loop containing nucleoside triphosphate hydrolase protein n=1 Tax=Irpex rosettiformis TaxID=378272 RepID=A0ACB8U163_9APHY|nr:P-loop containing nucleoside triphosphate hydrolase protein [Irpex rosettiformis]
MAEPGPSPPPTEAPAIHTRGYQQELLQESLRRNIVIALDTGSGKTHIAMLRMKHEVEQQTKKICWFSAPTVALIEQQRDVIASAIPVPVGLISGASEPDQWRDADLWTKILTSYRIVVSTPQILLDALRHGYINLGAHISLLVFDEAHHATLRHPYNEIMKGFYTPLPAREGNDPQGIVRPAVLGLTASPLYGGNVEGAFKNLEANLDCVIRSSRLNRDELSTFVHRPVFKHALYQTITYGDILPSRNIAALESLLERLDIEDDPYVVSLRSQLAKLQPGEQRNRVDQKLSKTLFKRDTFTHRGLRDLARTATDLCYELGVWAADWYIWKVLQQIKEQQMFHTGIMAAWQAKEKAYLLRLTSLIAVEQVSYEPEVILASSSPKVHTLIQCLMAEERSVRMEGDIYSGIVFATRRAAVVALVEILSSLPALQERFRIGCLLGTSNSIQRRDFLDITRDFVKETATQTLKDFKIGDKNLVVATSVAEEGLDIQACGNVIRFNPPDNMVSWAQSRGRARKQKSTYVIMFGRDATAVSKIAEWEQMEREMVALYTDFNREQEEVVTEGLELDDPIQFKVDTTGALLTLDSAIGHLHHFCSILPRSGNGPCLPIFDLDPPEMEEGWHSLNPAPGVPEYKGPWGATCILPRQVRSELRKYTVSCVYPSKRSARNHAAFFAYYNLYQNGLLNDHLLPLTSVIEPDEDGAVKLLLQEVEERAGLANVPIQMDPWLIAKDEVQWWYNELSIGDLPPLFLFTRVPLPLFHGNEFPMLYVPGKGAIKVSIHSTAADVDVDDDDVIEKATEYTRRMFASLYNARMEPGKTDFCYAFLPMEESKADARWDQRKQWQQHRLEEGISSRLQNADRVNADALAKEYDYPLDMALVRSNEKYDKVLRFIGWHYGPLSEEEEEELRDRYDGFPDFELTFPLLYVQPFPKRANFLIPLDSDQSGLSHERPFLLHPKFATLDMSSAETVQYAFQLPSVLHWLSSAITVNDMRSTLLGPSPPLSSIPFPLLKAAITASASQEIDNYQRLETLGDTVLKFATSINLFSQYPLWHEGYLARRKDHAVSNSRLAKDAMRLGLEKWIIRDQFVPKRKWRPRYVDESTLPKSRKQIKREEEECKDAEEEDVDKDADAEVDADAKGKSREPPARKKKKRTQNLSTKMLADVVESLIGAAYEHGSFDLGVEAIKLFGIGIETWDTVPNCVEKVLSRVEHVNDLPPQLALVEEMLGYRFSLPILLVEALTHGSYTGDIVDTVSYERLEFLGDAVLDMIVTDFLYHAEGKNYGPGHMHIRKESLVNCHLLAYICMNASALVDATMPSWNAQDGVFLTCDTQRIHLHQCLLHSSPIVLDDLNVTFARYEKNSDAIQLALDEDFIYPWAALTSLQASKFISDMLESLLGAVFLDSHGNLDTVRSVLRVLGFMNIMERIVRDEVDVLHPVSRLGIWAAKNKHTWEIKTEKAHGNISCVVLIDNEEEFRATEKFRGKMSLNEVRFAAAEGAVRKLHVIEHEEPNDVDDTEWGDIPEYIV